MILQPLVQKWKDEGRGIVMDGDVVCIVAFADDLYLFDRMLAELSAVLRAAGHFLQPDKCAWTPVGGASDEQGVVGDDRCFPRCNGLTTPGSRTPRLARMRMASSLCLALVAAAAALADGGAVPARYRSMGRHRAPPLRGARELPALRFVTRRVDHFDGANPATWRQAYYVNDTCFQPGSTAPVFLCVGGEGPPLDGSAVVDSVHCNVAVEWLRTTGALMFALEHRCYGCHNASACPVTNLSAPGALRFHSSRQALGDIAGFVRAANDEYGLSVAIK